MPAAAPLSASETNHGTLRKHIHTLKEQRGASLEFMAQALHTFRDRFSLVNSFQSLFPHQATRALRKALRTPPAQIHEQLLEAFLALVSKHHFPVDNWDLEYVFDQFPMIPIAAINHDEESELEGDYLATQIAATLVGYYSNAPSWEEIQQTLGPTIPVPTCFTDPQHGCRVNLDILREHCQQHPHPVSDFPTILQIVAHDTPSIFLNISFCYEVPEQGYYWTNPEDIQDLTSQWKVARQLMHTWIRTAKRLEATPRHWGTIFSCWQRMCKHETRTAS